MHRKAYCPKDSDFNHYYSNQIGSGFGDIRVVRAPRYQRGYGFGSLFGRIAMPLLKYLGKEALSKGVSLGKRVVQNPEIQQAFKQGVTDLATQGLSKIKQKISTQEGSGRKRLYKKKRVKKSTKSLRKVKRKRVSKKRKPSKKRDIFSG
jgi:hypothetical protein